MYPNKDKTQLVKGLVTDTNKSDQPKGSYTFALNTVKTTEQGDIGYRSNEKGNAQCAPLYIAEARQNFIPIGNINLTKGEVVLFLATEDGSNSAIAIHKENCDLQVVVLQPCLGFSVKHQIEGTWRLKNGCNRVIYFVDGYNPDKAIDLDDIINNPTKHAYLDENGNFDCTLTQLTPEVAIPDLTYVRTNLAGGNLKLGVYQFAISLADENFNYTNWFDLTDTIPIVQGINTDDFYKIIGGNPDEQPATTQSIALQLSNLDKRFKYVKIAALETISGTTSVYEAAILEITDNVMDYTYSGVDYNTAQVIPISEIIVPKAVYTTSSTIEQHDQRLIRGNVSSLKIDYDVLQQAACLIGTTYVTKPIRYKDTTSSVVTGKYYVDTRSYMRDEIYRIGIQPIFTDGTEGAILHIPGRVKDKDSSRNTIPALSDPMVNTLQHNRQQPNSNLWDSCLYNVTIGVPNAAVEVNLDDVRHLGFTDSNFTTLNIGYGPNKVPRWLVYNTAYKTWTSNNVLDVSQPYYSKGQLGYTESSYKYPSTKNCNGKSVYAICNTTTGQVIEDLAGKPIRDHRMPDTTLENHFRNSQANGTWDEDDYILTLGLEFDLTKFHQYITNFLSQSQRDKIAGYKIVRAIRDSHNKTVLDKGLAYNNMQFARDNQLFAFPTNMGNAYVESYSPVIGPYGLFEPYPFAYTTSYPGSLPVTRITPSQVKNELGLEDIAVRYDLKGLSIHSPKAKFKREAYGTYIKFEKEYWGNYEYYGGFDDAGSHRNQSLRKKINYINEFSGDNLGTPNPLLTNRTPTAQQFVDPNERTQVTLSKEFYNKTGQEAYCVEFKNYLPDIKSDTSVYGGGPASTISSTPLGFSLDFSFSGIDKAHYVAIKNYVPGIYGPISSTEYETTSNTLITTQNTVEEFSGDIFISRLGFRRTFVQEFVSDEPETYRTIWSEIDTFFVESEINCALRHLSTADNEYCDNFYPYYHEEEQIIDILYRNDFKHNGDFCAGTSCNPDDAATYFEAGNYCFNQYLYNTDYSKEIDNKPSFPLPLNYDYCSQCLNTYPLRVVYSEKAYQESTIDNYKVFLANNYRDLPGHTGRIMNLFKFNDQLFARTYHSLWSLFSKSQQLQTNQNIVQIGTGDFMEIPPKEVVSTAMGYAGGQTQWDLTVTPYGAAFADASQGIVFLLDGQAPKEISAVGNKKWFYNNLPFKVLESSTDFPEFLRNNTTSKLGVGLISCYDPNSSRLILTKRDYKVRKDNNVGDVLSVDENGWNIYVNGVLRNYKDPYNTPEVFENKSWTISYDLEGNEWISLHSYLPYFMFNSQNNFYSFVPTLINYTWRHGDGDYQNFYGTTYPHIIEFIANENPNIVKTYTHMDYESQAYKYNDLFEEFLAVENKTFDSVICYNDTQSTGKTTVVVKNNFDPFSSLTYTPGTIQAENVEGKWHLTGLRDMVTQTTPKQPLFAQNWNNIKTNYYIDKVPNSNIIDNSKSQFQMAKLRDHYIALRLYFSNPENHKLVTKYFEVNNKVSLR